MEPAAFPECNTSFGPPPGMEETQVRAIPAYAGDVAGGSCDGNQCVVVAYRVTKEEAQVLADGGLLYLSVLGGLPPHFLSFSFRDATNPA